jgi:flagellar motor switch protein FliM
MTQEPELSPEEVEGVLSGEQAADSDEPKPFSLREPVVIPPESEASASGKLEEIVSELSETFRSETDLDFELIFDGLQQQRASVALSVLPPPAWVVSIARPGGGGFSLVLPAAVGLALVDAVLGGGGGIPDEEREPTGLESRVLARFFGRSAGRLGKLTGVQLEPAGFEIGSVPRAVATPGETMAVGLLRTRLGDQEKSCLLLSSAPLLLPPKEEASTEQIMEAGPLAARLEKVALEIRPILRAGRVSLQDLISIEKGKIMRLDAPEDAPFELQAAGRTIAHGRIVSKDDLHTFTVERMRHGRSPQRSEK